jgi:hypothetical protein
VSDQPAKPATLFVYSHSGGPYPRVFVFPDRTRLLRFLRHMARTEPHKPPSGGGFMRSRHGHWARQLGAVELIEATDLAAAWRAGGYALAPGLRTEGRLGVCRYRNPDRGADTGGTVPPSFRLSDLLATYEDPFFPCDAADLAEA